MTQKNTRNSKNEIKKRKISNFRMFRVMLKFSSSPFDSRHTFSVNHEVLRKESSFVSLVSRISNEQESRERMDCDNELVTEITLFLVKSTFGVSSSRVQSRRRRDRVKCQKLTHAPLIKCSTYTKRIPFNVDDGIKSSKKKVILFENSNFAFYVFQRKEK